LKGKNKDMWEKIKSFFIGHQHNYVVVERKVFNAGQNYTFLCEGEMIKAEKDISENWLCFGCGNKRYCTYYESSDGKQSEKNFLW
jgi:hypothetical protein